MLQGGGVPNGKPQQRLRFRDLRSKTLAFKNRTATISYDLEAFLAARPCVQVLCVQKKTQRFMFALLSPLIERDFGECALVPALVPGNIRMYPRSGFWYRGTSAKTTLFQRCPQYCWEFHDQLWLFHGGGPSKKGNGTNRTGGSTILKLIWGGKLLYFPGCWDL